MASLEDTLRKVPPQSLDAEESVLGGVLFDAHALDRVVETLSVEDFYRESHRKIFRAMLALSEKGEPIDLITLSDLLKSRGELQDIGGATYLAELADKVPSAANIGHYARIVREKAVLRSLINVCNEITSRCYNGQEDIEPFLDEKNHAALVHGISVSGQATDMSTGASIAGVGVVATLDDSAISCCINYQAQTGADGQSG